MAIIFITGLSGVGKSSVIELLEQEGYNTVDTDYGYTTMIISEVGKEMIWDEEKVKLLIEENADKDLFVSGCFSNQGKFYEKFDQIVLLKCDLNVMLERIKDHTNNDYGKCEKERIEVLDSFEYVFPLLEKGSDLIIDTTHKQLHEVCFIIKELV
jgi:broad-specificity NMP kinase